LTLALLVAGCAASEAPPDDAAEMAEDEVEEIILQLDSSVVRLEGTVGKPVQTQYLCINCASAENHCWSVSDNAAWLDLVPSTGAFDCGEAEIAVKAFPGELGEGTHSATITVVVEDHPEATSTVAVELVLAPAPDPALEQARSFWESSTFRSYWDMHAASDVREVVLDYEFLEYDLGDPEKVSIKEVEFDFDPDLFERPISRVRCQVDFIVWDKPTGRDVEESYKFGTKYYTDTLVVLMVAPGPYSKTDNDWEVLLVTGYPG
jgi:hypothetical protein